MAPVDDALDRLERCIDWREGRGRERAAEALATVRSALEQLREERDSQDWYSEWYAPMKRRAEAAEAELQLLRGGISVRDALITANAIRAAAAEAEVRRYREGLREIAEQAKKGIMSENRLPFLTHIGVIAETTLASDPERHVRALLAGSAGEHAEGEGGET